MHRSPIIERLPPAAGAAAVFATWLAAPGTVVAASADPADAAGAAAQGGLPQLDVTTFPTQLFWLAVSFTLLYVLLSRVTLPRVRRLVKNREERIAGDIEAADALAAEAAELAALSARRLQAAKAEANHLITQAQDEAAWIFAKGQNEAETLRRTPRVDLERDAEDILAAAEARVLRAAAAMLACSRTDRTHPGVPEIDAAIPIRAAARAAVTSGQGDSL